MISSACATGLLAPGAPIFPVPLLASRSPPRSPKRHLGGEQSTITNFQKPKRPVVEIANLEQAVPSSSEPSPLAPAASGKPTQENSLGVDNKQLAVKSFPARAGKLEPTARLPSERKKLITERRKSRIARREAGRGLEAQKFRESQRVVSF
jgi:hypothetical protein